MAVKKTGKAHSIPHAALKLAAAKPWMTIRMEDVARTAGISLARLKKEFPDKTALLPAIVSLIDDETAKNAKNIRPETPLHDRLFEVMMARFDALQTRRKAIHSLTKASLQDPVMAATVLRSQLRAARSMLRFARIETQSLETLVQQTGLLGAYLYAFRAWLSDDSPDMAITMRAVDQSLRSAEKIIAFL